MEESKTIEMLVSLYEKHSGFVNTLWNIFGVVSLGVLGFVFKEKHIRESAGTLIAITLGFGLFAYGNQEAIMRSQHVLQKVVAQLDHPAVLQMAPAPLRPALQAHSATDVPSLRRGHTWLSLAVAVGIWLPFLANVLSWPSWLKRRTTS